MRTIQAVFVLALFSLALARGKVGFARIPSCRRAFYECDWEFAGFEGKVPRFSVDTDPDSAFTPRIVSKDPNMVIGIVNTNDVVSEFIRDNSSAPITEYGYPRFTPTHFKPYPLDSQMRSGVGHQTFQGNQMRVARGKCVRVFFTSYQRYPPGELSLIENINVDRDDYKCVVFRLH